jgi:hypothetical protein
MAVIEQLSQFTELAVAVGLAAAVVFGVTCFVAGVIVTVTRRNEQ